MAQESKTRRTKTTTPSADTKIKKLVTEEKERPDFYVCPTCGSKFKDLKSFPSSRSKMYAGYDYHIPICRSCLDRIYEHYVEAYNGNEEQAIRRICEKFDLYYHIDLLNSSKKGSSVKSRIANYISRANLIQHIGKTYDTTLDEERRGFITSLEDYEEKKEEGGTTLTKVAVERWGVGLFTEEEYFLLEDHYKMLKRANPNCDSNQEIFIKSLCHLNMLMMRSLKDNNLDGYAKANEQYGKTFTKAGLKTVQETDKNADDCWGVFMEQISQYTPEEYYKDKKLYEDFDNIGSHFSRFVLRPLKNLLCKTNERDPEFNVEGASDV